MAKDIVFKTPGEEGEYSKVLVVYDRPGSMLGPAHDMFAIDSVSHSADGTLLATRGDREIAAFHKDFPWFWVAKTEIEFLDPEAVKTGAEPEEDRPPGSNMI